MRAVIHHRYGGPEVLSIADVDTPAPGPREVLVRVHATTVNRTDCGFRSATPLIVRAFSGWRRPKRPVLGTEFAGDVQQIGADVTGFAVGDRVFGVNADRFGAHAEYVCVKQDAPIAPMPARVSFEEAAAMPDGMILALTCLRWTKVGAGTRLMIYGASGSIGTAGVQLARHLDADVTAVCTAKDVELMRALGADRVIDYTSEELGAYGGDYHVVFDAVGKLSFRVARPLLRRGGTYASTDGGHLWQNAVLMPLTWMAPRVGLRRAMLPLPRYTQRDMAFLVHLIETGQYRAVIDRVCTLDEIVDATAYVETERKTGNVVVDVIGADLTPGSHDR